MIVDPSTQVGAAPSDDGDTELLDCVQLCASSVRRNSDIECNREKERKKNASLDWTHTFMTAKRFSVIYVFTMLVILCFLVGEGLKEM